MSNLPVQRRPEAGSGQGSAGCKLPGEVSGSGEAASARPEDPARLKPGDRDEDEAAVRQPPGNPHSWGISVCALEFSGICPAIGLVGHKLTS